MPKIIYEERAVAFIDVLGFRTLVKESTCHEKKLRDLQNIVDMLASVIPVLDAGVNHKVPSELIPKHTQISDCIVLSAPLSTGLESWSHYNGLEIVMMRVSQLTHRFLKAGYILQGGIDVGQVWHGTGNIIGLAYQNAAKLEQDGVNPSILLSENAATLLAERSSFTSRMKIEFEGEVIVNGLHGAYIPSKEKPEEDVYIEYRSIVDRNIRELSGSAKEKWEWFKKYLEAEISISYPWIK